MTKSETGTFDPWRITPAARDVLAERRRQVEAEGWTTEHDDTHVEGKIAKAAACYALSAVELGGTERKLSLQFFPWKKAWWKPTDPRHDLVKAGALILAEIERLDRAAGLNFPPSDVPSEDGESDAAFVEQMGNVEVPPARVMLVSCSYWRRLITLASRAVFPPAAPALETVCRAICIFKGYDPDLTGDAADAGLPKDWPLWRLEEGLGKAVLAAMPTLKPAPDLATPYVPVIVDKPDGYSEFMLEDVPVYWDGRGHNSAVAWARDGGRFIGVRWPTRELPGRQSNVAPEPISPEHAWQDLTEKTDRTSPAEFPDMALIKLGELADYMRAAPPAPVTAGEVMSKITLADIEVHRTRADRAEAELHRRHEIEQGNVWYWQGDGEDRPESLTCQVVIRASDLRALLTAAQPRADAGEVTERMVNAWAKRWWGPEVHLLDHKNNRHEAREALRAALAAREPRS